MGRINKRTAHLRRIGKGRLPASAATSATCPIEDVVCVPMVEEVDLDELPTERQLEKAEWDEIFAEPDTDYDAETDEEDWSQTSRAGGKTWCNLQSQMQAAATSVGRSRQRYTGTSRTTVFRRKQAQKKACKDTKKYT